MFHLKHCLVLLVLTLALMATTARAAEGLPERYRDLKVYVTSAAAADDGPVRVAVQFVNAGKKPLTIAASVPANEALGLAAETMPEAAVKPGETTQWTFNVKPSGAVRREIVKGSITVGGIAARDLYIAFEGRDPEGWTWPDTERLTAPVTAVASYAPRTREAVDLAVKRAALPAERPVVLASPDAGSFTIILPNATEEQIKASSLDLAVSDLSRAGKAMTTQDVGVLTAKAAEAARIRSAVRLVKLDAPSADWTHDEAFHFVIADGGVTIESATLEGLRHGVYMLLTDYMDCHWFQPGTLGEQFNVPADHAIRLPKVDRVVHPTFFSVSGMSWGSEPQWDRRNRAVVNRGRMTFGHSWQGYVNPSKFPYDQFPDMYARDREGKIRQRDEGWTHTNFCSTSPQVIEEVVKQVNGALSNDDAIVASLDPNDYAPMCLCERCVALDKQYGVETTDGSYVTDRLLHFSKEIYDRLDEKNKGKYLGILVYAYQMELPTSAKPHAHHAGLICNQPWTYDHTRPFTDPTSPKNQHFKGLVKGWGAMLTQLGYYDYYGHWSFWGPWALVNKLREDLPAFRDMGGTYLMIEAQPNFPMHGVNHYVAAQLAWDVDRDVDVLLDRFYKQYYGPASEPMRAFWEAAERHQALTRSGPNVLVHVSLREQMWRDLYQHLGEARNAVEGASQTYRDRIESVSDGLEWGRMRFAIEGATGIRMHRPSTVDRNPDADLSLAMTFLRSHRTQFEALWNKYTAPGATDYWPRLTPLYFAPQFDAMDAAIESHEIKRRIREQARKSAPE